MPTIRRNASAWGQCRVLWSQSQSPSPATTRGALGPLDKVTNGQILALNRGARPAHTKAFALVGLGPNAALPPVQRRVANLRKWIKPMRGRVIIALDLIRGCPPRGNPAGRSTHHQRNPLQNYADPQSGTFFF
jgi:hypothetical protein